MLGWGSQSPSEPQEEIWIRLSVQEELPVGSKGMRFQSRGQTSWSLLVYYMSSHSMSASLILDLALCLSFTLLSLTDPFVTSGTPKTYGKFHSPSYSAESMPLWAADLSHTGKRQIYSKDGGSITLFLQPAFLSACSSFLSPFTFVCIWGLPLKSTGQLNSGFIHVSERYVKTCSYHPKPRGYLCY